MFSFFHEMRKNAASTSEITLGKDPFDLIPENRTGKSTCAVCSGISLKCFAVFNQ